MGVRYCDFKDLDRSDFDAVVVGSGFAGAVAARELAERGGSQCGYCTPGFVCAMAAEYHPADRADGARAAMLTGRLTED